MLVRGEVFNRGKAALKGRLGMTLQAQVNAGVTVAVCDTVTDKGVAETGAGDSRCKAGTKKNDNVQAFQITGLNFVNFGVGGIFPFHKNFGMHVELKFMVMVPTAGFVFAPVIGPVAMF